MGLAQHAEAFAPPERPPKASDDDVVTVGSDHDLRNVRIVGFYRERVEEGKRLLSPGPGGPSIGGMNTRGDKRTAAPTPQSCGGRRRSLTYLTRISVAVNFPAFSV